MKIYKEKKRVKRKRMEMLMQDFFYNTLNVYNIIVRELYSTKRQGMVIFGIEWYQACLFIEIFLITILKF